MAPQTYRAVEVVAPHTFQMAERQLESPDAGQVRIRVEACGVCHSDAGPVEADRVKGSTRVPGHEVVGSIDAVGEGVSNWQIGQRVGVGFLGGHCGVCPHCRRGDFVYCTDQPRTGSTVDGGYAEVTFARTSALVAVPDGLTAIEAAPLLCAGLTTFNALQEARPPPGSRVAIQGIGGLGHLGIQYAHKMGLRVVAIARGPGKKQLALGLGADKYIDSSAEDPGEALKRLGGAQVIVGTASSGGSMSPLVTGLTSHGQLVVVGVSADPISVSTRDLVFGGVRIVGSLTGSSIENENNLNFALQNDVRPMVETMPLEEAASAYSRMMSGEARFRMVLTIGA